MNNTNRTLRHLLLPLCLALGLGACAGMSRQDRNTAAGAGIGAVGGAVLTGGSTAGTVGGAIVGGVIGNKVGKDRRDRKNIPQEQPDQAPAN